MAEIVDLALSLFKIDFSETIINNVLPHAIILI